MYKKYKRGKIIYMRMSRDVRKDNEKKSEHNREREREQEKKEME